MDERGSAMTPIVTQVGPELARQVELAISSDGSSSREQTGKHEDGMIIPRRRDGGEPWAHEPESSELRQHALRAASRRSTEEEAWLVLRTSSLSLPGSALSLGVVRYAGDGSSCPPSLVKLGKK